MPPRLRFSRWRSPSLRPSASPGRCALSGGRVIWNFAPAPPKFSGDEISRISSTRPTSSSSMSTRPSQRRHSSGARRTTFEEAGGFLSRTRLHLRRHGRRARSLCVSPDGHRETVEAKPIQPVDTTGAGDTFVGILASGLDESLPFTTALERACRGASLACLAHGAQAGMPNARATRNCVSRLGNKSGLERDRSNHPLSMIPICAML